MPVIATVQIRRSIGFNIRREAMAIDGNTYKVSPAGEADHNRYHGEMAWAPEYTEEERAAGAPVWIAQGDLVFVNGT